MAAGAYAVIIGKLIQRFGLIVRPGGSPETIFPAVVPVTQLDPLALVPEAEVTTFTIVATGDIVSTQMTCPADTRWHVQLVNIHTDIADYRYTVKFLRADVVGGGDVVARVLGESEADAAGNREVQLPAMKDVLMFPGDRIIVNVVVFVSGADIFMHMIRLREECAS